MRFFIAPVRHGYPGDNSLGRTLRLNTTDDMDLNSIIKSNGLSHHQSSRWMIGRVADYSSLERVGSALTARIYLTGAGKFLELDPL
jgi:hypothetical protein